MLVIQSFWPQFPHKISNLAHCALFSLKYLGFPRAALWQRPLLASKDLGHWHWCRWCSHDRGRWCCSPWEVAPPQSQTRRPSRFRCWKAEPTVDWYVPLDSAGNKECHLHLLSSIYIANHHSLQNELRISAKKGTRLNGDINLRDIFCAFFPSCNINIILCVNFL